MNVDEGYMLVNYIVNKLRSGSVSADEINRLYALVNIEMFKVYTGLPEEYRPNMTPGRAWQTTQRITDTIAHLHKPIYIMRSSDGYFKLPSDYEVFSSLLRPIFTNAPECDGTPTKIWRKVEVVTEGERVERLQSRLVYPTPKKPIGCFYQGGIFVDPEGVDRVRLAYLKLPKTPVRGYTVTNNQDIYNASTSVQFDWPEIVHPDFIMRVCRYIGINLREEELVRYMLERIKSGE